MPKIITDEHVRSAFWTQIWYLKQKDKDKKFEYFKGLTLPERQQLTDVMTQALEAERQLLLGDEFAPAQDSKGKTPDHDAAEIKKAKKSEVHDPALYLFGQKKLWIPWAKLFDRGTKRGDYSKGYPQGIVIHWTAGHRNGLKEGFDSMNGNKYLYLLIDKDGNLGQTNPLNEWGYHAGPSSHPDFSGTVSPYFVGVELQAAGTLTEHEGNYYPWWDRKKDSAGNYNGPHQYLVKNRIPTDEVVFSPKRENIAKGYYHVYTPEQITALRKLVVWLHLNHPDVFNLEYVLGHDVVSPGRKTDPGGSIYIDGKSLTMSEFRDLCKEDVRLVKEAQGT